MNEEAVNYIVVLPGDAIRGEFLEPSQAEAHAADCVAQGSPEAHVYKRVGVVKRTEVKMTWVPVRVPAGLDEWLKSPDAKEIR